MLAMAMGLFALAACEGTVGDLDMKAAEQPPEPRAPGMPAIVTFDCSPETGAAPFQTQCTIAAKHPDGRPITCTLGVSDARANPIQAADCSAAITQGLSFAVEGTFTLTLTVADDNAM